MLLRALLAAVLFVAVLPAQIDRMNHRQWAWLEAQRRVLLADYLKLPRAKQEEVATVLHEAFDMAMTLLADNRDKLQKITDALMEQEEVSDAEIAALIGPSVHHKTSSSSMNPTDAVVAKSVRHQFD